MTLPPSLQIKVPYATAFNAARVRVLPDRIVQEDRYLFGGYYPVMLVFADEVRAVYVWAAPNWSTVIGGAAVALIPLLIGLFQLATPLWAAAWILGALAVLGWSLAWGLRLQPRRWIKIESEQGPLLFHSRREDVLQGLLSTLSLDTVTRPTTPLFPADDR